MELGPASNSRFWDTAPMFAARQTELKKSASVSASTPYERDRRAINPILHITCGIDELGPSAKADVPEPVAALFAKADREKLGKGEDVSEIQRQQLAEIVGVNFAMTNRVSLPGDGVPDRIFAKGHPMVEQHVHHEPIPIVTRRTHTRAITQTYCGNPTRAIRRGKSLWQCCAT